MSERPIVLFSRCLNFAACRYDGSRISSEFAARLADEVEPRTICPEDEIGLGIPRPTIRLIDDPEGPRLQQPETGRELAADMRAFSATRLDGLGVLDGAVLKARSPSCALHDADLHRSTTDEEIIAQRPGLFAQSLMDRWPDLPVADERSLADFRERERFLAALFAGWRKRTGRDPSSAYPERLRD